jgi:hypothetical protein
MSGFFISVPVSTFHPHHLRALLPELADYPYCNLLIGVLDFNGVGAEPLEVV